MRASFRQILRGILLAALVTPGAGRAGDSAAETEETWWSLRPLVRPEVPEGPGNPVDRFVAAGLAAEGWEFSPEASPADLVRRVYFDLTGLPPTLEDVEEYRRDDSPGAWERLVERLLDSPRYGERWARHWLDAVHFADTHGCEHDVFRPSAWRYRDYVITAFNHDRPWARFIGEQLAADVLYPERPELTPALGFLGAGPFDASAAGTAETIFEYLDRDDLVTQTMSAFTSTTVNCARCHDHKFDPVSQEDYFALQAVFAGVRKGEISYDGDAEVAAKRRLWQNVAKAAAAGEAAVLNEAENRSRLAQWEQGLPADGVWYPLRAETFVSTGGAALTVLPDGSLLSGGARPDKDTVTVTGVPAGTRATAIRLEVLPDPSLPAGGPGRADNGNLALSGIGIQVFPAGAEQGMPVPVASAAADWNQEGWTIAHAVDADPATGWSVFPKVNTAHEAVFRLEPALELTPGTRLAVMLKQEHGNAHLIGRFRISLTDAAAEFLPALGGTARAALTKSAESRSPEEQSALAAGVLGHLGAVELARLPAQEKVYAAGRTYDIGGGPVTLPEPRVIHLLERGDTGRPGKLAEPGALTAVRCLEGRFTSGEEGARRAALAAWLGDGRNPLTWRSITNRVWHWHFGRGLAATPEDLGRMGSPPTHPELLDWLAAELRDHGGSLKRLHRILLTSRAWKQSSAFCEERAVRDPDNRLLWRMNRRRLEAESFRDAVLAVSGQLDLTEGGPGIGNFVSTPGPQSTPSLDYAAYDWKSPGAGRRSIYRVVWRGMADPLMEALDFPDAAVLTSVRGFSASPLQALALWNNNFVLHHAAALAERAGAEHGSGAVAAVVRRVLLRDPDAAELAALTEAAAQDGLPQVCRILFNSNEFLFIP